MKSNWNLPPGVSAMDIEPEEVECPTCNGEGEYEEPYFQCNEADFMMKECRRCGGSGHIRKDQLGADE